ncbi:Uncharacterised protein [Klebsiella pneumoniae]|uniref:Uncharacterized protein n=1 Tax=Klebsiella pneumoniae TaxID=573 RepID=A0A377XMC7_KLEPN|nr:Uncharacterised protein [Klebsiella pneumoniae]
MCYAVDLTTQPNIDYQQYSHEDWKQNLFFHYLGVLYCCETDEGKKIVSGAVVKTCVPHLSELENNIAMRIIEKSPKLKAMHAEAGAMPDLQYHYPFPAGKNAQSGRVSASPARLLP